MQRFLAATILGFAVLASGCGLLHRRPAQDYDRTVLDRQLYDVAQEIARTQAELRGIAAVSRPNGTTSPRNGAPLTLSRKPITIEWQGDAAELTRILSTQQGYGFETRGVKVPLPVSLVANHLPLDAALALLTSQLDYRAAVYTLPGRLVLEYLPSTGVTQ